MAIKSNLPKSKVERKWIEIDLSKFVLGRAATQIATFLRGKHKRDFAPNIDAGDFVVAINAGKVKLTGRKLSQKKYYHHSGYLGGIKSKTMAEVFNKNPGEVLKKAVFSMIDDIKFRKTLMSRLKVFNDATHTFKIDKKI